MHHVYVADKKGRPLMPTIRLGHVRKLLKEGKAVPISHSPFTIRLKYDVPGSTQPVYAGIDTGRENIGAAASYEDGTNVYLADIRTSNKSIKKNMQDRAGFRRARRRHDRLRSEGWITPSGKQAVQVTMSETGQAAKILPVTPICPERVSFDFQKLEKEDITGWEYGRGPLYGYRSYREYIWDEQHGRCACCGKPVTQYHHITPRAAGGADHVKHIIGLYNACHGEIHRSADAEEKLKERRSSRRLVFPIRSW